MPALQALFILAHVLESVVVKHRRVQAAELIRVVAIVRMGSYTPQHEVVRYVRQRDACSIIDESDAHVAVAHMDGSVGCEPPAHRFD
jgi:hypothetical protein